MSRGNRKGSVTEKHWTSCCEEMAAILVEEDIAMPEHPMMHPEHQRERFFHQAVEALRSNEMLSLLGDGIEELSNYPAPEAEALIASLIKSLQGIEASYFSREPGEWGGLDHLLKVDPELWSWAEALAIELAERGELDHAIRLFALTAFCQSSRAESWYHLGFALYQQENYELAAAALASACSLSPQQPEFAILKAACHLVLEESKEAGEMLQVAERSLADNNLHLPSEWQEMHEQLRQKLPHV